MEVTVIGWLLAPVALAAVVALAWGVFVTLRAAEPGRTLSECLLATSIITPLVLYAEVRVLSVVPLSRPLDWLPYVHSAGTLAFLAWTHRYRPAGWKSAWKALSCGLRQWWQAIGVWAMLGTAGLSLLLLLYFALGMYSVPGQWDELDYHIPMAFQPYQDGRFGPVGDFLPTARLFPRGAETLWYWTLQFTHTDLLFHPVQLAFGVQLLLGIYVLARRSGAAPREATVAGIALGSAPIFYLLATTGYVDIAHASSAVAVLAFLAPTRACDADLTIDWHYGAAAFAETCLIKYPFLAVVFAGVALAQTLLFRKPWRGAATDVIRFVASRRGVAALLVLVAGSNLYLGYWYRYGNPFYPFRVAVAGQELLPGPHTPGPTNAGGQTSAAKSIEKMNVFERYYYAWTDFAAPLTIESFGSFGPVLPFGLLVPALAFGIAAFLHRNSWRMALALIVVFCLVLTPAAVPRYGIPVVSVLMACGVCLLSELPARTASGYAAALLLLTLPGTRTDLRSMRYWMKLNAREAGISLRTRNLYFVERYDIGAPFTCSRPMIRYIRYNVPAGTLMVWNVRTLPALLLNLHWSNRLLFLPGSPREVWPGVPGTPHLAPEPTAEELAGWLAEVQRLKPHYVLVYAKSAYARALCAKPELGYAVGFEDGPDRGEFRMVLFEHAPATSLTQPDRANS